MRLKFNNNAIRSLLFAETTVKLCEQEAQRIVNNMSRSKYDLRTRKATSIKKTRHGVAVFKPCMNRKMLENVRKEMLNATKK